MMSWANPDDATKFNDFINADKNLAAQRGQWSQRLTGIAPFEHHFDLHVAQDFYYDKKSGRKVQAIVDFINISNLLNREWGLYYEPLYNLSVLGVTDLVADEKGNMTPTYNFQDPTIKISDFSSRWRCQVGLRLTF